MGSPCSRMILYFHHLYQPNPETQAIIIWSKPLVVVSGAPTCNESGFDRGG